MVRNQMLAVLAAATTLAFVAGCNGGGSNSTTGENVCNDNMDNDEDGTTDCDDDDCATDPACVDPIPVDELVDAYLEWVCENMMACDLMGAFYDDLQECLDDMDRQGAQGPLDAVVAAIQAGDIVYDEDAAGACLAGLAALGCEVDRSPQPEECDLVFTGKSGNGVGCNRDEACISGWCDIRGSCPGICADRVTENGTCASGEICAFNLVCVGGTCQQHPGPLAEGATCWVDHDLCAFALYCDATSNQCTPRRTEGQSCNDTDECAFGLFCGTSNRCVQFEIVNQGESCDPPNGRFCNPLDGLTCPVDTDGPDYLNCEPMIPLSSECFDNSNNVFTECAGDDLYCDDLGDGLCKEKKTEGGGCMFDKECISESCSNICDPITLECWEQG